MNIDPTDIGQAERTLAWMKALLGSGGPLGGRPDLLGPVLTGNAIPTSLPATPLVAPPQMARPSLGLLIRLPREKRTLISKDDLVARAGTRHGCRTPRRGGVDGTQSALVRCVDLPRRPAVAPEIKVV